VNHVQQPGTIDQLWRGPAGAQASYRSQGPGAARAAGHQMVAARAAVRMAGAAAHADRWQSNSKTQHTGVRCRVFQSSSLRTGPGQSCTRVQPAMQQPLRLQRAMQRPPPLQRAMHAAAGPAPRGARPPSSRGAGDRAGDEAADAGELHHAQRQLDGDQPDLAAEARAGRSTEAKGR
jgi:hypothetical protein